MDKVEDTPTGDTVIVPDGPTGLPTLTPVTQRTFPIRDIKLLSDTKLAFTAANKAEQSLTQRALTLFGIIASAAEVLKDAVDTEKEKDRLLHRIAAATDGAVKFDDIAGIDFKTARIILVPKSE